MFCIYCVTNNINNKKYIGQHKYEDESNPMGKYKGSGILLNRAYKKYGIENFTFEVLYQRIRDKSTVDAMEIWAIEKYKPEYNIAKGGSGGDIYNCLDENGKKSMIKGFNKNNFLGHKHTEESKRKISMASSGEKNGFYGRHHLEETKKRISEAHKGQKQSEETKRKKSEASKLMWERRKAKLQERVYQ